MAASDIRAGGAYIEVFTRDMSLQAGLAAAEKKVKAFAVGVKAVGDTVAGWGKKLMALGAIVTAPFVAAAKTWSDAGAELAHMAQRTGMTVEALSALKYAAGKTGVEFESIEGGVRKMQKLLVDAARGSTEAAETIGLLGLKVEDLAKMNPDEQFLAFADAIAGIQDPTARAGMAMAVFGKTGTNLLPLLENGAAGLAEFRRQAEAAGRIMSKESAEAALKLSPALKGLWGIATGIKNAFATAVTPVLTGFAQGVKAGIEPVREWIKGHQELVRNVFMGAAGVAGFGLAMVAAGKAIGLVSTLITSALSAFSTIGTVLGAVLSPVGLLVAGLAGLAAYFYFNADAAEAAAAVISNAWDGLVGFVSGVLTSIDNATSGAFGAVLSSVRSSFSTVFSGIWSGVQSFFGDCAAGFQNVMADGQQAFGTIAEAISQGDLSTAFEIVVALLRLEWARLVGWFTEKWLAFKAVWTETISGFELIWNDVAAKIKTVWAELLGYLTKLWDSWSNSVAVEWTSKLIAPIIAKIEGVDVEDVRKNLTEDFARGRDGMANRAGEIDTQTAKQKAAIETERKARAAEIGQEQSDAAAARHRQEADASAAVDDARKKYNEIVGQPLRDYADNLDWDEADLQAQADAWGIDPEALRNKTAGDWMKAGGVDTENMQANKVASSGTFNPFAAAGMGGGVMDRIAKATEDTAKGVWAIEGKTTSTEDTGAGE